MPAFLVSHPVHIRYLSGVRTDGALLLVTPRCSVLFTDAFSADHARRSLREGVMLGDPEDLPRLLRGVGRCGIEAEHLTVGQRTRLRRRHPRARFVPTIDVVEPFRRRKAEDELRLLRRAQRITRTMLRDFPALLKPGVSEAELARWLRIRALELGAEGLAFDPIVAFGTHTSFPHHVPTSRRLRRGHLVQIDVGARVGGYCADLSRVFFTAPPTPKQRSVFALLRRVQREAIRLVKAGVTTHDLDRRAREMFAKEHCEKFFPHALGHGVGLEIHEGVTLSRKRPSAALLSGEVITIEPGLYFPGAFGMRIEDMVFIP